MNNKNQTNLNHLPNESTSSGKHSSSMKDMEREDYALLNAIKRLVEDEVDSGEEYNEILEYTDSSSLEEAYDKVLYSINPGACWNKRFNDEIPFGRQLDIVNESRFYLEVSNDELQDSDEFNERLVANEAKFDEINESHRKGHQIGQQCQNFIKALRKSYIKVNLVKKVTQKFNPRETALVWATWKGLARRKYYPKG